MRTFSVLCAAVLLSGAALGQTVMPGYAGYYGCSGPYIPFVTTPKISLETVSAAPVGASNATYGLNAGATNATLSESNLIGNTGGVYTQPVWYAGGTTPLISSPAVQLPYSGIGLGRTERMEPEHGRAEAAPRAWIYYASEEETSSAADAATSSKSGKRAGRTITNQDVEQQNQKNGLVKYDNKTEQLK
jgi:hypothetical protein